MIVSFNEFLNENFISGRFLTNINGREIVLKLQVEYINLLTKVYLIKDNKVYDNLSINLPDSRKLREGEFFLNPDINSNIVKELTKQNFITKQKTESIAGDKKTTAYKLNI